MAHYKDLREVSKPELYQGSVAPGSSAFVPIASTVPVRSIVIP